MTPGAILLWAQIVLEFGVAAERFAALCQRVNAGDEVTEAELQAARQANVEAVNAWDNASQFDRDNEE